MANHVWPVDAVADEPLFAARHGRQLSLAPLLAGATATRPLGAISGVRPGTPSTTVEADSTTWTVHPHAGVLDVQAAAEAGPYSYAIDADVEDDMDPAHATLPRWDGIYVCVDDPAESDGSSVPALRVEYVAGTAASSPAMPTAPDRSMLLARIVVPASGGGSPSVVWLAPTLAAAGGVMVFGSVSDRNAAIPTPADGMMCTTGTGSSLAVWLYMGSWVRVHARIRESISTTVGTGTIVSNVVDGMISVLVAITSASLSTGTTTVVGTIGSTFRPLAEKSGGVYLSGYPGALLIATNGEVSISNQSGGTRNIVRAAATWPTGE